MPYLRDLGEMTVKQFTLLLAVVIYSLASHAAEPNTAANETTKSAPRATTPIAVAAAKAGVLGCAGRIDQVSQFIGANSKVGAYFFAPPPPTDQRLVSFSYEVQPQTKDAPLAYASASFAPNQANGCGAMYEAVVYWPQNCDAVAAKQFAQLRKGRSLQTNILVLESETPARVFLMPAGRGCVSVKKELVM
jgi:hypothetical protein